MTKQETEETIANLFLAKDPFFCEGTPESIISELQSIIYQNFVRGSWDLLANEDLEVNEIAADLACHVLIWITTKSNRGSWFYNEATYNIHYKDKPKIINYPSYLSDSIAKSMNTAITLPLILIKNASPVVHEIYNLLIPYCRQILEEYPRKVKIK